MAILISPADTTGGNPWSGSQAIERFERSGGTLDLSLPWEDRTSAGSQANRQEMADQELICHLLTGDRAASGRFVRRFERLIHRQLHDLHVPLQDHEDLFQEVFLHLWEHDCRRLRLWQGRGRGLFSSYLRVVIRRLICDVRRARAVPLPVEDAALAGGEPEEDPESLLLSQEQQGAILQAVAGLRQRDRDLICRRYYRGESYKEMAAGMGLTVGHVGVALARAEQRLKAAFCASYPDLCEIR